MAQDLHWFSIVARPTARATKADREEELVLVLQKITGLAAAPLTTSARSAQHLCEPT
jgi:hypothetical protein